MHRRSLVRIGSLLPLGLTLGHWPGHALATSAQRLVPTAKSCILLWLDGGPSHLELWDPKVQAPQEVRGPFGSIPTSIPGVHFSEVLTHSARLADRMTIVRSLTSPLGEHGLANHYLLTGYPPSAALQYPSMGSVVAHQRREDRRRNDRGSGSTALPSYIGIPEARLGMGAGFLGVSAEPFLVGGDASQVDFRARDLDFYPGVDGPRIERRRKALKRLEAWQETSATGNSARRSSFEDAFALATDAVAKEALDLSREPEALRAKYGSRPFAQGCLLARRLVERSVPFVTVVQTGWDTHENLKLTLRDGYSGAKVGVGLIPTFDQAVGALIEDLEQRGLLDETLVVAMGEFGRTPKLNPRGGRDHWPRVFSAMLCGGGMPRGMVLGASDRIGESPKDRPVTPADLARTIFMRLGIDPETLLQTPDGRPVAINALGRGIDELL